MGGIGGWGFCLSLDVLKGIFGKVGWNLPGWGASSGRVA